MRKLKSWRNAISLPHSASHRALKSANKKVPTIGRDDNNIVELGELVDVVHKYDVISFDFFDTIAHRNISLQDIYRKVANFAAMTVNSDNQAISETAFLAAREALSGAVKQAHIITGARNEICLQDIFERALRPYIADSISRACEAARLVRFETELEVRALSINTAFHQVAEACRELNKKIILISDMYLPQSEMEYLLDRLGVLSYFDHVFVSAEVGFTKASGEIFPIVDSSLGIASMRRLHIGDNYNNDFLKPAENGWDALHYFNRDYEVERTYYSQRSGQMIRRCDLRQRELTQRLRSTQSDPLEKLIDETIAPAVWMFAFKTLSYASRARLTRLYFVTRDGVLFKKVAEDILRSSEMFDVSADQLSTLELSRVSGVLLEFNGLGDLGWAQFATEWMTGKPFSIGTLLAAFGFSLDDVNGINCDQRTVLAKQLDCTDLDKSAAFLREQGTIRRAIENLFAAHRMRVVSYLRQNDVDDKSNVGFVDIGYSGTLIKHLSSYWLSPENMERYSHSKFHNLFFATNRFARMNAWQMHPGVIQNPGFILDHRREEDRPLLMNFGWLEPFIAEPLMGRHLGFDEKNGQSVARFAIPTDNSQRMRIRDRILQRCAELNETLIASPFTVSECEDVIVQNLRTFVTKPTRNQIRAMSTIIHDFGIAESQQRSVLRWITPMNALKLRKLMQDDVWLHGSFKRSGLSAFSPLLNLWARRQ